MPSESYSFLDVVVLDPVRQRFAAGDALAILTADLNQVIWANGPGASILGYPDIEAVIGAAAQLPLVARRQIMATSGFPDIGTDRAVTLRLATGMTSRSVRFLASAVTMPDGEPAILLAVPAAHNDSQDAAEIAARAISGFTEDGHFIAFLDEAGDIEAASEDFATLGITSQTLSALVTDVAGERDRLVKRIVPAVSRSYPAGLARLTDNPARHLLVVIDERGSESREPAGATDVPSRQVEAPTEAVKVAATASKADEAFSQEGPQAHHDHWYFSSEHEGPEQAERPTLPAAPPQAATETQGSGSQAGSGDGGQASPQATDTEADIDRTAPPVRFVWRTDAEGRFSAVSPEFVGVVGEPAADILGRRFRDVATTFGLDPSGEIAGLLERRDTWSGRSVFWPLTGKPLKVPVDLAALPVYDRDRVFEGFRGFGVIRAADAMQDPEKIGLALAPNVAPTEEDIQSGPAPERQSPEELESVDPFEGEVPALTIVPKPERRYADKVIRLAEHRQPPGDRKLSTLERSAFREIGERLKKENEDATSPQAASKDVEKQDEATGGEKIANLQMTAATEAQPAANADLPDTTDESASQTGEEATPTGQASNETGERQDFTAKDDETAEEKDEASAPEQPGSLLDYANSVEDNGLDDRARERAESSSQHPVPAVDTEAEPQTGHHPDTADTPILDKLPVPLLIHSGDVLHYANDEFLELTGYETLEDLVQAGGLGALFADRYGEDGDGDAHDHALHLRTRDGSEFPIDAILRSVPWNGSKALMLVVRRTGEEELPEETSAGAGGEPANTSSQPDISELKARIAEMRTIIDTATDGVVLIANDGTIRSISRPAEALFGFDSDDVAGKPFQSLFAIESQRAARDYLAGLSEPGVASVLNDGREVIGREAQGRFIPLFMTIGRLPNDSGFCAVVRDITQWKRAEEDLTQARTLAERSSSQKTEFLARISHEIRTPLNAIIGFSELMVDEKFGPVANDRYRDYLRDINRSGNHVLDLVNDLLDISKIEAGQQEMDYVAVSLNDTLTETVAMMQPQANRERVIIRSSFASRLPEVVADLRSVRQIALNILSNAIRYTQAGGQVIVSTAYEPSGDVVMRVRDTGIGMTQAEIEQALKPFKQINALKRGRGDGTGLGLPLTKAMVEANRARFTINSTPGEGTLVEVAFPSTRVLAD